MSKTKLEGKISRVNVNHVNHFVTFMLEGDKTPHRLKYGKYADREEAQALDLTQPGDTVSVAYYAQSSRDADGDLILWDNQTSGMTAKFPGDML